MPLNVNKAPLILMQSKIQEERKSYPSKSESVKQKHGSHIETLKK